MTCWLRVPAVPQVFFLKHSSDPSGDQDLNRATNYKCLIILLPYMSGIGMVRNGMDILLFRIGPRRTLLGDLVWIPVPACHFSGMEGRRSTIPVQNVTFLA